MNNLAVYNQLREANEFLWFINLLNCLNRTVTADATAQRQPTTVGVQLYNLDKII